MKVIPVIPRGYCHGVVRAIRTVEQVLNDPSFPRPIHLLGRIVHNEFVVESFRQKGVLCWDEPGKTRKELLDRIESGTVVITAHGVGNDVWEIIRKKKLAAVDATCPDVYRTHELIMDRTNRGIQILYIGKKGHPETEGAVSLSPLVGLIERMEDIPSLPDISGPVCITNQTTLSIREIRPIIEALRIRYPQAEVADEICPATRSRQEALLTANRQADACVVVGDPRSNNTASLARLSETESRIPTFRIASAADLSPERFQGFGSVTVTSGASTPPEITEEVIRWLQSLPF
jgi:4-hydroxy-3-methylbut-2-enyl diphosphate reductase